MLNLRTLLLVASLALFSTSGCKESGRLITRRELGDNWPFTVASGVVDCVGQGIVVFKANGNVYALNGTAKTQAKRRGYMDDLGILRATTTYPTMYVSTHEVIRIGLTQCKN